MIKNNIFFINRNIFSNTIIRNFSRTSKLKQTNTDKIVKKTNEIDVDLDRNLQIEMKNLEK